MKREVKIITHREDIKSHLEKLYDKIDFQVLLHEANISQENSILSKKETNKLRKYNLDYTTSVS